MQLATGLQLLNQVGLFTIFRLDVTAERLELARLNRQRAQAGIGSVVLASSAEHHRRCFADTDSLKQAVDGRLGCL